MTIREFLMGLVAILAVATFLTVGVVSCTNMNTARDRDYQNELKACAAAGLQWDDEDGPRCHK